MARPKQQHYVTKAYLEGFLGVSDEHLVCYGRGNRGPFRKAPRELASQRDYYALRKKDGTWDDSIENLLGETVESPGLPLIRKLAAGKTRLSGDERQKIAVFIAVQEMRTPAARERVRAMSKMVNDRIVQEVKASDPQQETIDLVGKGGKRVTVTLDEIAQHHDEMCDDHSMSIHQPLINSALKLAEYYQHMKLTVYYPAGDAEFLTTDTPVIRVFHDVEAAALGAGINRRDVEVRFPLSCKALLTLTHDHWLMDKLEHVGDAERRRLLNLLPEVEKKHAKDLEVTSLNKAHARHAHRWVFAPQEIDWIPNVLDQPSTAPTIIDLSSRDLFHFQSTVNFDPKRDT
jgi:hypothetical protein